MSTVKVGENESLDNAIKRFKRKCARDGIIGDLRRKEAYEKPSVARKKKAEGIRRVEIPVLCPRSDGRAAAAPGHQLA